MNTETAYPKRSEQEISQLKADWERDPCWDIEFTEGFEAHRDELIAYRVKHWDEAKERVKTEDDNRRARQRGIWGIDISDAALDYMNALETRLSHVEGVVELLKPDALYQY